MRFPNGVADQPVRLALLAWAGIGLALTTYGVYDTYTYSCPPGGDCGEPMGFVLVLWGLVILGIVTSVAVGRFAVRRFRGIGGETSR